MGTSYLIPEKQLFLNIPLPLHRFQPSEALQENRVSISFNRFHIPGEWP